MKKLLMFLIFISVSVVGHSQNIKLYSGSSYNLVYRISDGKVYKGNSTFRSDLVYTIRDGKVYESDSHSSFDIVYTIRDNNIYKGKSTFSTDIIARIIDGKIYKGRTGTFSSDLLFTIKYD